MEKATLFFATNRNHKGSNRWKPKGYGKKFSSDGHYNLRFGKLEMDVDPNKVKGFLNKSYPGNRTGDGEGLSEYLAKQADDADIQAYRDETSETRNRIARANRSSTKMFSDLKERMMNATDVVILIHGYNVSWEEAVGTAMSMQYMLNNPAKPGSRSVQVVLFSWPSDGSMMPFAAYKSDRDDAEDSAKAVGRAFLKLRDYLATLHRKAKKKEEELCNQYIHLLCHSMGNYVLENALQKMIADRGSQSLPRIFEHIFMCAADVDDQVLERGQPMGRLHELTSQVTVYHNRGDLALSISDYTKSQPERLGQGGNAHPQNIHNKIHQVDCSPIVKGIVEHSYFLWSTVNDDIRLSVNEVAADATERVRKSLSGNRIWELK